MAPRRRIRGFPRRGRCVSLTLLEKTHCSCGNENTLVLLYTRKFSWNICCQEPRWRLGQRSRTKYKLKYRCPLYPTTGFADIMTSGRMHEGTRLPS